MDVLQDKLICHISVESTGDILKQDHVMFQLSRQVDIIKQDHVMFQLSWQVDIIKHDHMSCFS